MINWILNKFKQHSVSVLKNDWTYLKEVIKVTHVPRIGEVISIDNTYYNVLGVIHNISNKQGIFLVVDKLEDNNKVVKDK